MSQELDVYVLNLVSMPLRTTADFECLTAIHIVTNLRNGSRAESMVRSERQSRIPASSIMGL